MDLLKDINRDLGPLAWANAPAHWEVLPEGGLRIHAPAKTDYFQNPNGDPGRASAPYFWLAVEGDFVARAHVKPTFAST
jgi:regulation of enolase protein 1 (concanavalin A-like superfamily)